MCNAMGDARGRKPDSVRLLVESGGEWEPELVRIKRMIKHWLKEAAGYGIPASYWDALQGTTCKQGPISLLRHDLEACGIGCMELWIWNIDGRRAQVN